MDEIEKLIIENEETRLRYTPPSAIQGAGIECLYGEKPDVIRVRSRANGGAYVQEIATQGVVFEEDLPEIENSSIDA